MKTLLLILILSFALGANAQTFKKHKRENYSSKVGKSGAWWESKKKDPIHKKITYYRQGWGLRNNCRPVYGGQPIKRKNMKKMHYASNKRK